VRRRGSILVIAGVLVVLMGLGIFSFQQVMRQRYLEAYQHHFGEVALTLAESGLDLALEHIQESSRTPGTLFYDVLIQTPTATLGRPTLAISVPALDGLVDALEDAALQVDVEVEGFGTFEDVGGMRGVVPDPREKVGSVTVVARASYRGVERVARLAQEIRVVRVTPPVLSKFTLFLHGREEEEVNLLHHDPNDYAGIPNLDGEPATPLVLHHRSEPYPAVVDRRFFALGDLFDEDFSLDDGGLVYLGGDQNWTLQLMHGVGDGDYEELFHLRRTRYVWPSTLPSATHQFGLYFGFYDGILESPQLGSAAGPPGTLRRRDDTPIGDGSSALRLYGDVNDVSPTLVLGSVYRSYLTMQLLDGLWYPWMGPDEFAGLSPMPPAFAGGYEDYQRVMPQIVVEAYNRSHDFVASNHESLVEGGQVESEGTPFFPASALIPDRLIRVAPAADGDDGFLYPDIGEDPRGRLRIRRDLMGTQEEIFSGALADLDAPLMETLLMRRVTSRVEDGASLLEEYLVDGALAVPGVVRIEGGDLEVPGVRVGGPGMILVEGNVVIQGPIAPSPDGYPLTLVALNGDVRVETDEPVHACLVSLRGRFLSRGKLDLRGSVAASSIDLRQLVRGPERKDLRYEQGLDPTAEESYWKAFAVVLTPHHKAFVARR
jgi:hypothetical protein